jgi:hypothetical protein
MSDKTIKIPGPDHPIIIERNAGAWSSRSLAR